MKLFMDGPTIDEVRNEQGHVDGFTTNPSLMRRLGVTDYLAFASEMMAAAGDRPVSIEITADDDERMMQQGSLIADLGDNAWIKVPVTNTRGEFTGNVIEELLSYGASVNVTAVFTPRQAMRIQEVVRDVPQVIVSVFAGRIADTGWNPVPFVREIVNIVGPRVLWASTRQIFDFWQARAAGCEYITMTKRMIDDMWRLEHKSLDEFSLETVQQFRADALAAGYVF